MSSERPVEISRTYTPGKNLGRTRTITVHRVPATEVTYEGETDFHLTFEVADRIDTLIERALRTNNAPHQTITYTAFDPGVPVDPRPWNERFEPRRARRQVSASGGDVR